MDQFKQDFETHPLSVTILSVVVLCITFWNALRTFSAVANWGLLSRYAGMPGYILGTGLLWALGGLALYFVLWEGARYGLRAGLGAAVLYLVWYWCDRLFIQPSPSTNILFSALVSGSLFAIFVGMLILPSTRAFFKSFDTRRQDERQNQEDSGPS